VIQLGLFDIFFINGENLQKPYFDIAVSNGHVDLVTFFLGNEIYTSYDNIVEDLFINSCESGSLEIVKFVLNLPIAKEISYLSMITTAMRNNSVAVMKYLFQNYRPEKETVLSLVDLFLFFDQYYMLWYFAERGSLNHLPSSQHIQIFQKVINECHSNLIRFILPMIDNFDFDSFILDPLRCYLSEMKFKVFKLLIPRIEAQLLKTPSTVNYLFQQLCQNFDPRLLSHFLKCLIRNNFLLQQLSFPSHYSIRVLDVIIDKIIDSNSNDEHNHKIIQQLFRQGTIKQIHLFHERYFRFDKEFIERMGLLYDCLGFGQLEKIEFLLLFNPNIDLPFQTNSGNSSIPKFRLSPKNNALYKFLRTFNSTTYKSELFSSPLSTWIVYKSTRKQTFQLLKSICLKNAKLTKCEETLFDKLYSLTYLTEYICFSFLPSINFSVASSFLDSVDLPSK
jgi:hypothetical protein